MALVSERAPAPSPRTSFFGRERERAHVSQLLRRGALVTLTGPGGVGKTRLAAELIATEADPATVRWCVLTAIDEDEAVAAAVADALGRGSASTGPERAVVDAINELGLLLVIDNCEHVVLGVAELVERVLEACPEAVVLATSREPLGVEGEAVVALGPLGLPEEEAPWEQLPASEAVALFLDRARLSSWEFELDPQNAADVARICRRLDGLPLALELAAARIRSLSPAEIADRLDSRFGLLARPRSRGAERHRTLRGAIDWSYRLLEPPEQVVFDRLSVMAAPTDLATATALCADGDVRPEEVLDILDRLVERSLVRCEQGDGGARYSMLESLRHYGLERLAERGEIDRRRSAHAEHFAAMAESYRRDVEQAWWGDMVRGGVAAFPEVRAAAHWSMRRDPDREQAFTLLIPLWALAHSRHATEILELCDEALRTWPLEHDDLGQALLGTAAVAGFVAGRAEPAAERAALAVAAEEARAPRAVIARRAIALVTYGFRGDVEGGIERLDEVIDAAREEGVRTVELEMRVLRSQALQAAGRADDALREATLARGEAERYDSPYLLAWALYILGTVFVDQGEEERAGDCFAESLRLARRLDAGFYLVIGLNLRQLGMHALRVDQDEAEAAARLAEALDHFAETGDCPQVWDVLRSAAPLFLRRGRPDRAAAILAGAESDPRARRPAPLEQARLATLRQELGDDVERLKRTPPELEELGPLLRTELAAIAAGEEKEAPAAPDAPRAPASTFRQDGELWLLAYDGAEVHMPDLKGLHDLARLLADPGVELHCLELAGAPAAGAARASAEGEGELALQGDAGELLDEQGRAEYRRRMSELREEAELAETANDIDRAERAREELDRLTDALAAAFGLGGRARKSGDPAERARSAVTWRIRSAVSKVEAAHPALGAHLRNSVSTGTFCSYRPERPVRWIT